MEDTVVTPILERAARSWRQWAPWAVTGIVTAVAGGWGIAMTLGGKQEHHANMEANYTVDRAEFKADLLRIEGKVDKLAGLPEKVDGLDGRMKRTEEFLDNAREEAGKWPQPRKHH